MWCRPAPSPEARAVPGGVAPSGTKVERIVMALPCVSMASYAPGETRIVSPADAASIAA